MAPHVIAPTYPPPRRRTGTLITPYGRLRPADPAPPSPPVAAVYFATGEDPDTLFNEIWKYDGATATHVADLNLNGNNQSNDPVIFGSSALTGKIYVVAQDYEALTFAHGANVIHVIDPATDVMTHVVDYNYVATFGFGDLTPPSAIYDDGAVMYIAHQCWGSNDWHLVRFDPLAQTTELVFGPYDGATYYSLPAGLQNATAEGQGFIARVGANLYLANGSELFVSATGDSGSWALLAGAGVYQTPASYTQRAGISIGLIGLGDYDADGNYWFPATNTTGPGGGSPWAPHSLWNLSVFKIAAADGALTLEYQNLDDGLGLAGSTKNLYGYQATQLINRNGVLTVFNDGVDSFSDPINTPLASSGYVFDNHAGWAPLGQIPFAVYQSLNQQATSGPVAGTMLGTDLLIITNYNDGVNWGTQLLRENNSGVWSQVQQWPHRTAFPNSRGVCLSIVRAP